MSSTLGMMTDFFHFEHWWHICSESVGLKFALKLTLEYTVSMTFIYGQHYKSFMGCPADLDLPGTENLYQVQLLFSVVRLTLYFYSSHSVA